MRRGLTGRVSGRGSKTDPDIPQGRPKDMGKKTIEEFQKKQKKEREERKEKEKQQPRPQAVRATVRPRTVLRFTRDEDKLLISGGLAGGKELAGTPAVVDCKLGEGHIVMFSINPMWRNETHGSYFMVLNAMLNYDHLDAGKK
jgi:hypothetical protein